MNSITDKVLELNKSIELLNLELKRNRETKSKDDPEYVSDEYMAKVQSVIANLDIYNFHNYTLKNEVSEFYHKSKKFLSVNESIILGLIKSIIKYDISETKKNFLTFNEIFGTSENIINKEDFDNNNKIYNEALRAVNKILNRHKYYNKPMDKDSEDNFDLDKCLNNLMKAKPTIEFFYIKIIIIAIINHTIKLINTCYKNSKDINTNNNTKEINEVEISPSIYNDLFIEYAYIRDNSFLIERSFSDTFYEFRNKHNISFTLQDLLADIFWNIVFHDKNICQKYFNLYTREEKCNEEVKDMIKNIYNALAGQKNPVKDQIIKILGLTNIEQNKINLISSILNQQVLNHDLIHNELMKYLNGHCIHCNNKLCMKKCKNKEIVQETNSDDNNANNGLSFENKTVDEIINYINEDKDNKKKKKKRNKKKKNKKNDEEIENKNVEDKNEINIEKEDLIVNEFKQFILDNIIDANKINKIKPVISQDYLKIISEKY